VGFHQQAVFVSFIMVGVGIVVVQCCDQVQSRCSAAVVGGES